MDMDGAPTTPLMQQYATIKQQYPDALVLFQVGDFYELFYDDAKAAAAFLGITLTKRGKDNGEPIPLCGVPVHAIDHYLKKLVKGGFKVALCDQEGERIPGTIVNRRINRVLTPGTLTDDQLLDATSASYILACAPGTEQCGLVFAELLTAQIFATVVPIDAHKAIETELVRFFPDEIILPNSKSAQHFAADFKRMQYVVSPINDDFTDIEQATLDTWVQQQFSTDTLPLLHAHEQLRIALYYFYAYLRRNNQAALSTFRNFNWYNVDDFLMLDAMTQHNLELVSNHAGTGREHTLLAVLDGATTAMGSRMIKKWLVRPLVKHEAICQRQEVISCFIESLSTYRTIEQLLATIGDIERVIGRILLNRAPINDYRVLTQALQLLPSLKELLSAHAHIVLLAVIDKHIEDFRSLCGWLSIALNDDSMQEHIIKKGFSAELDRVRALVENGHQEILALERVQQESTGIGSLKIRYNSITGYYIEITKTHYALVPDTYKRIQTLVGRERFTMPALQQLHYDIERAKGQIGQVEAEIFEGIKKEILRYSTALRKVAHALSTLDALSGLAKVAYNNGYSKPTFNTERIIKIIDGRHPVIEHAASHRFIPNSTLLDDESSVWIITGPNMGGKSTYLRQVALICIMAHIGSFVPAGGADIALLDRIFTRIGAGDNLAQGKSTFLVEMEETATICMQATANSLVILDEVGRGTSTLDGLAIARAVIEYLALTVHPRCLFATHYHELTALADAYAGMRNYYAANKHTENGIVFLYKIISGVSAQSFGIEVAKRAQLPAPIIERAYVLLAQLTHQEKILDTRTASEAPSFTPAQVLAIDRQGHAYNQNFLTVINYLDKVDLDEISPRQAYDMVVHLKALAARIKAT